MKVAKPSLSHSSVQSIAPIERPKQEWPISCARHGARLPSPAIREHWSWYSYRNHCHNILKVHSNQYLEKMNLKIPFIWILSVLDVGPRPAPPSAGAHPPLDAWSAIRTRCSQPPISAPCNVAGPLGPRFAQISPSTTERNIPRNHESIRCRRGSKRGCTQTGNLAFSVGHFWRASRQSEEAPRPWPPVPSFISSPAQTFTYIQALQTYNPGHNELGPLCIIYHRQLKSWKMSWRLTYPLALPPVQCWMFFGNTFIVNSATFIYQSLEGGLRSRSGHMTIWIGL